MVLEIDQIRELRQRFKPLCGIYFLFDGDEIVYIGQSVNILARVGVHFFDKNKQFNSFAYIEYPLGTLAELEAEYILIFVPKYNANPPGNSKWQSLDVIKKRTGIGKNALKKFVRQNKIQNLGGYFLVSDFAAFMPIESVVE